MGVKYTEHLWVQKIKNETIARVWMPLFCPVPQLYVEFLSTRNNLDSMHVHV